MMVDCGVTSELIVVAADVESLFWKFCTQAISVRWIQ